MADGDQVTVDTVGLSDTAAAVRAVSQTQRGHQLTELVGGASAFGDGQVHAAFGDFCSRWSDGLDVLTEDAETIADALDAAVAAYRMADELNAGRYRQDRVLE